jgi:hypothetical protein
MILMLVNTACQAGPIVTVVPQIHYLANEGNINNIPAIARSQFEILALIKKEKGAAFFTEGLVSEWTSADLPGAFSAEAKAAFPDGLPSDFGGLTEAQIRFLGTHRAGEIALILGYTDRLYPTTDEKSARLNRIRFDAFLEVGAKRGFTVNAS